MEVYASLELMSLVFYAVGAYQCFELVFSKISLMICSNPARSASDSVQYRAGGTCGKGHAASSSWPSVVSLFIANM